MGVHSGQEAAGNTMTNLFVRGNERLDRSNSFEAWEARDYKVSDGASPRSPDNADMGTTRTVHLIDASAYIFRAYFALPDSITDSAGAPAQATWGFGAFLLQYVQKQQPTHLGVAFDQSLSTSFRNEIYPA